MFPNFWLLLPNGIRVRLITTYNCILFCGDEFVLLIKTLFGIIDHENLGLLFHAATKLYGFELP